MGAEISKLQCFKRKPPSDVAADQNLSPPLTDHKLPPAVTAHTGQPAAVTVEKAASSSRSSLAGIHKLRSKMKFTIKKGAKLPVKPSASAKSNSISKLKQSEDGPVSSRTRKGGKASHDEADGGGIKEAQNPASKGANGKLIPGKKASGGTMSYVVLDDSALNHPVSAYVPMTPGEESDSSFNPDNILNASASAGQPNLPPSLFHPLPSKAASKRKRKVEEPKAPKPEPLTNNERLLKWALVPAELTADADADPEIHSMQALILPILNRACPACKIHLFTNGLEIAQQARTWLDDEGLASQDTIPFVTCPHCAEKLCLECHTVLNKRAHKCSASSAAKFDPGRRLLFIWIVLCGLEEHLMAMQRVSPAVAKKSKKLIKKSRPLPSTAWEVGIGYGGDSGFTTAPPPPPPPTRHIVAVEKHDGVLGRAFACLTRLLPAAIDDEVLFPIILKLLSRHIVEELAILLANDSLQEAAKRDRLYRSALGLAKLMLTNDALRPLITEDRVVELEKHQLLIPTLRAVKQSAKGKGKRKAVETEMRPSIAGSMQGLGPQCGAVRKNAHCDSDSSSDEEYREMLELCDEVEAFLSMADSEAPETAVPPADRDERYSEEAWHREQCVDHVEDDTILDSVGYYHSAVAKGSTESKPGRMKRLLVEMATLRTSLPPGIFVRHEMSRPDVLKLLIIGPQDTPYAYGAFEFDVFCPASYPAVPPMVQFKTTGGGTEGMNPNLYPDGKVCLSLLGTWQGQPWQPNESTLLQVFLSLQAMVFCADPYYNEPGWSHTKNEVASLAYNVSLYRSSTHYAVIDWLERLFAEPPSATAGKHKSKSKKAAPPPPSTGPYTAGLWDDVLIHHFSKHAKVIEAQVDEWREIIKRRDEEQKAEAEKAAAAKAKGGSDAAQVSWPSNVAYNFGLGRTPLETLMPRLYDGLKRVVARAEELELERRAQDGDAVEDTVMADAEGGEASGDAQAGAKRAIKSPVEQAKDDPVRGPSGRTSRVTRSRAKGASRDDDGGGGGAEKDDGDDEDEDNEDDAKSDAGSRKKRRTKR